MLRMTGPPPGFSQSGADFADHVCLGASPWGDVPQTGCGGNPQACLLAAWEPIPEGRTTLARSAVASSSTLP